MSIVDVRARAAETPAPLTDPAAGAEASTLPGVFDGAASLSALFAPASLSPTLPAASFSYGGGGAPALAFAQTEVGQREEPPGSNDGARIALYRTATAGAAPGAPWCAYFVSWAAAQAGAPLGETGQGYGAVEDVAAWAARAGRLLPAGARPAPGDLILFGGRHIGIVESVNPDGSLTTIEGNHQNAVSRVQRSPAEATGYVRL